MSTKKEKEINTNETVNEELENTATDALQYVKQSGDVKQDARPGQQDKWGDKNISRKFLALALAGMLLLNAAITAGMMKYYTSKVSKSITSSLESGRSGDSQFYGGGKGGYGGRGGRMNASEGNQNFGSLPESGENQSRGQVQMPDGGNAQGGNSDQQTQQSKASIGIVIREDSGVIVSQVTGDNAKKAGLKEGDVITSVDGKTVSTSNDLISALQSHKAGDTITINVNRNNQAVEIKTVLE